MNSRMDYCGGCHKFTDEAGCKVHGSLHHCVDSVIPTLAIASLPQGLNLQDSQGKWKVVADTAVKLNTLYGPLVAPLLSEDLTPNYIHTFTLSDGTIQATGDQSKCNWMMFVRKAQTSSSRNLILVEIFNRLYFVSCCEIQPGEELLYDPTLASRANSTEFECPRCKTKVATKDALDLHTSACPDNDTLVLEFFIDDQDDVDWKPSKSDCSKSLTSQEIQCADRIPITGLKRRPGRPRGSRKNTVVPTDRRFDLNQKEMTLSRSSSARFTCSVCQLAFRTLETLQIHEKYHKRVEEAPVSECQVKKECDVYTCPACKEEYQDMIRLAEHVTKYHSVRSLKRPKIPSDNSYEEMLRKKIRKELREELKRELKQTDHLEKNDLLETTVVLDEDLGIKDGSETKKQFQCEECGRITRSYASLQSHVAVHKPVEQSSGDKTWKRFKCPLCNMKFKGSVECSSHTRETHRNQDGSFTCNKCQKSFPDMPSLSKHLACVHVAPVHACTKPGCSKTFKNASKLKQHQLIHSEKSFMCHVCARQFARKDKLKEHIEKLHPNGVLDLSKNTAVRFEPRVPSTDYHRFIYRCEPCQVGFKRRGMLVNHINLKHPADSVEQIPELNMPILRPERQYYCSVCPKVYKTSNKRRQHMLKDHPEAEVPNMTNEIGVTALGLDANFSQTIGAHSYMAYQCNFCHKQYASLCKLNTHIKKDHKAVPNHNQVTSNEDLVHTADGATILIQQSLPSQDITGQQHEDAALNPLPDPLHGGVSNAASAPLTLQMPDSALTVSSHTKDLDAFSHSEFQTIDLAQLSQLHVPSSQLSDVTEGQHVYIESTSLPSFNSPTYHSTNSNVTFSLLNNNDGQTLQLFPQQIFNMISTTDQPQNQSLE